MGKYSEDTKWADVIPLPQDDVVPKPLANIVYPEAYVEATAYLRAIMAANEHSERVLGLTADIIIISPSHYTVWIYRFRTLVATNFDLREEIAWINPLAIKHQKNYQIWHHRQSVIDKIGSWDGEADFINEMMKIDSKNYHVWSYRQWAVKRFDLWDDEYEMKFVERLLDDDLRNNSAWNHRWYLNFGRPHGEPLSNRDVVEREYNFVRNKINLSPQNESSWNYLRALYEKSKVPELPSNEGIVAFIMDYAPLDKNGEGIKSSHALDLLSWILGRQAGCEEQACIALDILADKYDPIRANYWKYRKAMIQSKIQNSATV